MQITNNTQKCFKLQRNILVIVSWIFEFQDILPKPGFIQIILKRISCKIIGIWLFVLKTVLYIMNALKLHPLGRWYLQSAFIPFVYKCDVLSPFLDNHLGWSTSVRNTCGLDSVLVILFWHNRGSKSKIQCDRRSMLSLIIAASRGNFKIQASFTELLSKFLNFPKVRHLFSEEKR